MLNLLRRVRFPSHLNVSQPVIKGNVVHFVERYDQIIDDAHRQAADIIQTAKVEAERILESVRQEVSKSLHDDLQALKNLTHEKDARLRETSMNVCTQVCNLTLERFVAGLSDEDKIRCLLNELLSQIHNARKLHLRCHSSQLELVRTQLADHLAEQFNLSNWGVEADDQLEPFDLKLQANNGSEIRIHLKNVLALYAHEIELFLSRVDSSGQEVEKHGNN